MAKTVGTEFEPARQDLYSNYDEVSTFQFSPYYALIIDGRKVHATERTGHYCSYSQNGLGPGGVGNLIVLN